MEYRLVFVALLSLLLPFMERSVKVVDWQDAQDEPNAYSYESEQFFLQISAPDVSMPVAFFKVQDLRCEYLPQTNLTAPSGFSWHAKVSFTFLKALFRGYIVKKAP